MRGDVFDPVAGQIQKRQWCQRSQGRDVVDLVLRQVQDRQILHLLDAAQVSDPRSSRFEPGQRQKVDRVALRIIKSTGRPLIRRLAVFQVG